MPLLANSWESLIAFVVILLLSGISSWLRQRKAPPPERLEEEPERPAPIPPWARRPGTPEETPSRQPEFDLERELRRLFGEEEVKPPPPPVVVVTPREAPPPPPPPPPPLQPASPAPPAPSRESSPLAQAELAYQRASGVDAEALARLEAARARVEAEKALAAARHAALPIRPSGRTPEVEAVLASLRSPLTARQAVLASIILGPPKALEPPSPAIPGLRW